MIKTKIFTLLFLLLACFFTVSIDCKAWGPIKQENEEKFLAWYEENKNTDGAVYELSGDLPLTRGSEDQPICLDGQGNITIKCTSHTITVDSNVTIDNPNLTICGEYFPPLMVRDNLTLSQGTACLHAGDGTVIQQMRGSITTSGSGTFTVSAQGNNVTGIALGTTGRSSLSGLNIEAHGTQTAVGISAPLSSDLTISDCQIHVTGGSESYGIRMDSDIFQDLQILDSTVKAETGDAGGLQYSVFPSDERIHCHNSTLEPKPDGITAYIISEQAIRKPVYVETNASPADWQLPSAVDTYAVNSSSSEEELIPLPVTWELPEKGFEKQGYQIINGIFASEYLGETVLNPQGIVPSLTVLCLPAEKMFLISYEKQTSSQDSTGLLLLLPHPYDADSLKVEYSTDGNSFSLYGAGSHPNLLVKGTPPRADGLYAVKLTLPVTMEEDLYIRMLTEGDSLFKGTSAIWKIPKQEMGGLPEGPWDDGGGDRGGQDTELPEPEKPDAKLPEAEGPESGGGAEVIPSAPPETNHATDTPAGTGQPLPSVPLAPEPENLTPSENIQDISEETALPATDDTDQKSNAVMAKPPGTLKEGSASFSSGKQHSSAVQYAASQSAPGQTDNPSEPDTGTKPKENNSKAVHNRQWPVFLTAAAGIFILALAGIWTGSKLFAKDSKNNNK